MINFRLSGIVAVIAFILSLMICVLSHNAMPMLIVRPLIFGILFFIITTIAYFLVTRFLPELVDEHSHSGGSVSGIGNFMDEGPLAAHAAPGSRIDITEGDAAPSGIQPFMNPDDSVDELGNISEIMGNTGASPSLEKDDSSGMDQNADDGYTKAEGSSSGAGSELPLEDLPTVEGFVPLAFEKIERIDSESGTGNGDSAVRNAPSAAPAKTALPADTPDSVDVLPDLDTMAGAFRSDEEDGESDTMEYSVSTPAPKSSKAGKDALPWTEDFNAKDMAMGLRTVLNKEKEG